MKGQLFEKLNEKQQLFAERQRLLDAQAGLLKNYIMSGMSLPVVRQTQLKPFNSIASTVHSICALHAMMAKSAAARQT